MLYDFISVTRYLTSIDVDKLSRLLQYSKIPYQVNEHGPNTGNGQNLYFEIKVSTQHYSKAKAITQKFKAAQLIESQRCPKCGSLNKELIEKPTIIQRIIYVGTTPVRCKKCSTVYAI